MFSIHRSAVILFFLILLGLCGVGMQAQCNIPPAYQKTLSQLSNTTKGFVLYQQRGLIYLDSRCFDEARSSFRKALEELPVESNTAEDQIRIARLGNTLIAMTHGYEAWNRGDLRAAINIFDGLCDDSAPQATNIMLIHGLGELLLMEPDPELWSRLEPKLRIFERKKFWRAHRCLMLYGLNAENAPTRIAQMESALNEDLSVKERLQNEIILAEIFLRTNRLPEASILTKNIENDVGMKAIDTDLRLGYIVLCSAIADAEAKDGDREAVARAQWLRSIVGDTYAHH